LNTFVVNVKSVVQNKILEVLDPTLTLGTDKTLANERGWFAAKHPETRDHSSAARSNVNMNI
jgi:hypothetical protein